MARPGPALAAALAAGPVLLDGGLATELERAGADLSGRLWSARLLRDDPGAVLAVHRAFVAAGAQVVTTASYQASVPGFARAGIGAAEGERLLRRSVDLARASGAPWVAASVGPYGAFLADGSEYRGRYGLGVAALGAWHRPRLEVLASAGPDVLACETVPCLAEAEALLAEVDRLGVPAWLSLTADGPRTRAGEPAVEAFAMAASVPALVAVGVNCCAPGRGLPDLVRAAVAASGKPAVVYPNSGETWDAQRRAWAGSPARHPGDDVRSWVAAGARLVGGCCRVGPDAIAAMAAVLRPG